jgi:hypothetical protein
MNLLKLVPGVKDYEKIVLVVRRDKIVFLPKIFLFLILLLIPWLFYFFLEETEPGFFEGPLIKPTGILALSAFYLFNLVLFLTNFVDYFLDVWIVTNERIVDIRQEGLFARTVAETRFYWVQDVTAESKGFLPTIFGYGNVYVQTAAETGRFVFSDVPEPYKIAQKIMELVEADRPYHEEKIKLLKLEQGPKILDHPSGV